MKKVIIGTRGSDLALWQANYLMNLLKDIEIDSELKIIKTRGDIIQHLSFDKIEGKGFFTKEIEQALLQEEVDLAVHSMKDLPTSHPAGLVIGAVSKRANPHDLLLISKSSEDSEAILRLKKNAIVGTSSARRKAQILNLRDDIALKDIRGNVPTRIHKLREGEFDAIVLAAAGIERLELDVSDLVVVQLHHREFVPAPAQGILAFQCHVENLDVRRMLLKIHNPDVSACSNIERTVLKMMDGGCHLPLGVYCQRDQMDNYHCFSAFSEGLDKPLRKVNLSQSTTVGLAEKIYNNLING